MVARKEESGIHLGLDLARRPKSTMAFTGRKFARRRIGVSTTRFGSCKKTEGTKGHDNLHHVEKDVVRKEVEKRRAAAKATGVKPDGSGG